MLKLKALKIRLKFPLAMIMLKMKSTDPPIKLVVFSIGARFLSAGLFSSSVLLLDSVLLRWPAAITTTWLSNPSIMQLGQRPRLARRPSHLSALPVLLLLFLQHQMVIVTTAVMIAPSIKMVKIRVSKMVHLFCAGVTNKLLPTDSDISRQDSDCSTVRSRSNYLKDKWKWCDVGM